jgi:hypothetical protein
MVAGSNVIADALGGWCHAGYCSASRSPVDELDGLIDDTLPASTGDAADVAAMVVTASAGASVASVKQEVSFQLAGIKKDLEGQVHRRLETTFNEQIPVVVADIKRSVQSGVSPVLQEMLGQAITDMKVEQRRQIAQFLNQGIVRQEIIIIDGLTKREMKGEVFHARFEWVLKLARAGKPIFIPGPTGAGKTHLAEQVARALGLQFGMISCSPGMTESKLTGRSIPNISTGEEVFRTTEFIKCYEDGGVFLFDEMDAADPTVLLVINAALANGMLPLPERKDKPIAKRHKNFVCIAAANTWGTGADRQYVGRNRLDEATLDRFRIGIVPVDYSPAVERHLCPDGDLYDLLLKWREGIRANRLERVLSTRFIRDAHDMLQIGASYAEIAHAFFSGWPAEQVRKVYGGDLPAL